MPGFNLLSVCSSHLKLLNFCYHAYLPGMYILHVDRLCCPCLGAAPNPVSHLGPSLVLAPSALPQCLGSSPKPWPGSLPVRSLSPASIFSVSPGPWTPAPRSGPQWISPTPISLFFPMPCQCLTSFQRQCLLKHELTL